MFTLNYKNSTWHENAQLAPDDPYIVDPDLGPIRRATEYVRWSDVAFPALVSVHLDVTVTFPSCRYVASVTVHYDQVAIGSPADPGPDGTLTSAVRTWRQTVRCGSDREMFF